MKSGEVYILKCADGSYYTGITNNLDRRIAEHLEGEPSSYVNSRRPFELVYAITFQDIRDAISFEKQIKGWSRAKKEALIKGDLEELVGLSNHKKASTGSA